MKSSKSITNYIVVLLAVLVLISSSVTALKEDFSAFGNSKDVGACACDLKTDSLTIHNTGDVTSTFMFFVTGDSADWVDLAPQTFYLEQGEVKQIERFIKVPCGARGEYVLNTTIKTLFDTEKVLEQTLKVENCPNIQIIPKFSGSQEECPCTPVQYGFEVVNTGNHMETYEISVEPYSDAISLSTDFLILEPGEKQEVSVFINLECGQYGERIFTFNVLAQGTKILGQTDFVLNIKKCYDYELVIGEEYGVCQGVPNIIPFQIQNKANIANEYILAVDGADWAYPENETAAAWGGETIDSNVLVFPPNEDEGLYTIALNSISVRGEEERTEELLLETEKCYDYELIETDGVFQAAECKAKDHVFVLRNIGSRETTYYIDLEGFDWLTTTKEPIQLQSGEEVELVISGEAPCGMFGDYLENIYVTINEIDQTYLEEKIFSLYAKEDAYMPEIELSDLEITYEGGETEIKITNKGFEAATYDLSLVASDWISIDQDSTDLGPGENTTVLLQAWPTNETVADLYSGELIIDVVGEEIEYSTDFFVELREKEVPLLWLIALVAGAALLVIIIIIILALVLGKKKKKPKKEEIKEEKKPKKDAILIEKQEYRKKKKEEKKIKLWPIILLVVLAVIVGGSLYCAFSFGVFGGERNETISEEPDTPEVLEEEVVPQIPVPEETPTGVLTNAEIQESLITIDREGIVGEGNELELTNETEINLLVSIKNPTDRKARFAMQTQEDSWVEFEKDKIAVMPNSIETINLKITPDLDALEENDYAITINTTLEGKKIYYEETLDLVLTKQKPKLKSYWPWALAGLITLLIILLIISLARREKKPKVKKETVKEKKVKAKEKPKKATKIGKKESKAWIPVVVGIIIIILVAALGFWAYNTFQPVDEEMEAEEIEEETEESAEELGDAEETAEPVIPAPEPKITEEDVEESLITIDRSSVPGDGDIFKLEQEQYVLPISIKNPTERKARFTVSTGNESWVTFDQYKIIVEPNSVKIVEMNLIPDTDALSKNDYMITINTKLEGARIDYQEELSFVLKQKKDFEAGYLVFALAGLILVGLVILIIEIAKKGKEHKTKKPAKKEKKSKDISQINKELDALRKKTVLKLKKASY